MPNLTPEQIAEGRALVADATPGPWERVKHSLFVMQPAPGWARGMIETCNLYDIRCGGEHNENASIETVEANCSLVEYLLNNASALLDAADELAAYKAAVRQFASLACATGNTIIAEKILQEHNLEVK
jgi:hypothetical protein